MLPFREITLEDRVPFEECAAKHNYFLCDHCFADVFIWRGHYHAQICFWGGFVFIKSEALEDGRTMYLAPIGEGDLKEALSLLLEDSKERGIPFYMASVSDQMIDRIEAAMPEYFTYQNDDAGNDYIYLSEKLQTLSGKKLQSKRNLVNRFKVAYEERWSYEPLTDKNTEEAFAFHLKWIEDGSHLNEASFNGETCAISTALMNRTALHLVGGILRLDGQIIGLEIGCQSTPDLFVIQIEKADHTIPGAYQMINQQYVLHNCTNVKYVNREEDLGIDGLRKAKRSYGPVMMGVHHLAVIQ